MNNKKKETLDILGQNSNKYSEKERSILDDLGAVFESSSLIYEPTKVALENLYSRVVKGGIVAFDELNCTEWKGETIALREFLDLSQVALKRFPSDPYISYFVKGE